MNRRVLKKTPFGPVVLMWSVFEGAPKVFRVLLSRPESSAEERVPDIFPDCRPSSCAEIDSVAERIRSFLAGEDIVFPLDLVALGTRPEFQQDVLRAEHAIPRGHVSAYGLIAARLGKPKGARAVGNALATNPFPLIVPCHRAVRSDGGLGGFQGGARMKRALLELEGVPFDGAGRAVVPRFHYS